MKSAVGLWFVTFLVLTPVVFLCLYLHTPPEVVSAGAPLSEFSAERAFEHLKVLASQPHPVGSPFHDNVRDYILNVLTKLELRPEVQMSERTAPRSNEVTKFENIVARVPGSESGKGAMLLVAHYDSVPESPGASDNGSGVVTLLEVARALKARPALPRDVVLLFSDGEELGLRGARAFLKSSIFQEIGFVLNFDARGSGGPVFMFETGANNHWAVGEFGKVVPFPFATSLGEEIYKLTPHDTDFTVFRNQGLPGFNFAHIEGPENYHLSRDNLGNLDLRSIQHQGSYALALASHFGNLDLNRKSQGNAVFFDVLGKVFISYSERFVRPVALVITLLLAGVLVWGVVQGRLKPGASALGFVTFLTSAVCSALVTTVIAGGLSFTVGDRTIEERTIPLLLGLLALNCLLIVVIYRIAARRISYRDLSAGALLGWLSCMLLVSFYLPLASYIFQWSLVASVVAFAINVSVSKSSPLVVVATNCLGAVPALALFTWTGRGIFEVLGLRSFVLVSIVVLLMVGLLLPALEFWVQSLRELSDRVFSSPRLSVLRSVLPKAS